MNAIEVFKGPSTLKYGPNSIGGAINLISRPFESNGNTEISLKYGQFNTLQLGGHHQLNLGRLQLLVEAHRWQSDGFKELPKDDFTGFYKDDVMLKARFDLTKDQSHILDLKVNWSDEKSYETYLGLSNSDFTDSPFQRYASSANDQFDHVYWAKELRLFSQWSDKISTQATLYRHDFTRTWAKFDRFDDINIDVQNVLLNPTGANETYYQVLTGEADSTAAELLRYGINARDYYSQGLNLEMDWAVYESDTRSFSLDTGVLFHQDEIDRNHSARNYNMLNGRPVFTGSEFLDTENQEIDRSDVFRGYAVAEMSVHKLTLRFGSRYESVASRRNDKLSTERVLRQDDIWIPGGGLSYQLTDNQMLFFGAHKGITLPGPGEVDQVKPEEAINYELGYRFQDQLFLEVVAFYSDYKNLLGTCSFSAGCTNTDLDDQFNSGKVEISGLETQVGFEYSAKGYRIPVQITNTFTQARFAEAITSANKIWGVGDIKSGDPLPYVPKWKTTASLGVKTEAWSGFLIWSYQSRMFDQAVRSDRQEVDSYSTLNFNGTYNWSKRLSTNLKLQNITNEEYIVSLRPFGARPGAPFWATAGLTYRFQ